MGLGKSVFPHSLPACWPCWNHQIVSVGKSSDCHRKSWKPQATNDHRYLALSKSVRRNQRRRGPPRSLSSPVGRELCSVKQTAPSLCMERLIYFLCPHLASIRLLRVTERVNQTQPISTELTLNPQPLIEHPVFAEAFWVSRVCMYRGGATQEPGSSSRYMALTEQGLGAGQQRPHTLPTPT